ncbi:flagellar hook-basal body complex protein [uncultured Clostridium sp.]|uniref:flagellar hook-basal body complex protein n=1 Tax=uncultured Clostridium sp. TaxID=59620 RepID=UPI0028EA57FB|nr:flagellar hook-basal body complex protein [uncultured Clostridium sp.]
MALRCMYSGISGMKVNQNKLDVIGNNIANSDTTAFKASSARFKDMLYQNAGVATAPTVSLGGTNNKQVGLGAQLSSINKLMTQGNALSTNRTLDFCIDGDGYFIATKGDIDAGIGVDATTGSQDSTKDVGNISQTYYTRDGNLALDYQGNLLTSDGHRIMGYYLTDGNATGVTSLAKNSTTGALDATYVNADSTKLEKVDDVMRPLAIPDSVTVTSGGTTKTVPVTKIEVGTDGVIIATLGDNSRTALGQIGMASFKNPEGLTDKGGNFAESSANSGPVVYKTGKQIPATSGSTAPQGNEAGFGSIIQGALEGSNVDLTEQFTDLITATRSFQASSKMISTGDEILQTITGLIR